jgi:hypothetical protein
MLDIVLTLIDIVIDYRFWIPLLISASIGYLIISNSDGIGPKYFGYVIVFIGFVVGLRWEMLSRRKKSLLNQ